MSKCHRTPSSIIFVFLLLLVVCILQFHCTSIWEHSPVCMRIALHSVRLSVNISLRDVNASPIKRMILSCCLLLSMSRHAQSKSEITHCTANWKWHSCTFQITTTSGCIIISAQMSDCKPISKDAFHTLNHRRWWIKCEPETSLLPFCRTHYASNTNEEEHNDWKNRLTKQTQTQPHFVVIHPELQRHPICGVCARASVHLSSFHLICGSKQQQQQPQQ